MSDFKIKATADLDTSQLEAKLMALQNRKITIQANANIKSRCIEFSKEPN